MTSIYDVPVQEKYTPVSKKSKFTKGRMTQLWSNKTGRTHYFWSKLMESVFYYLEFSEAEDIREAFPLINIADVLPTDEKDLMSHYINKSTGKYHELTTTFLVKLSDGSYKAIASKYSSDLKKKEVNRFIHMQKRFWVDYYGIDFSIVTEKEINPTVVQNLKLIRESQFFQRDAEIHILSSELLGEMKKSHLSIREFCLSEDIDSSILMNELKHQIFVRDINVNLKVPFNIDLCLSDFLR